MKKFLIFSFLSLIGLVIASSINLKANTRYLTSFDNLDDGIYKILENDHGYEFFQDFNSSIPDYYIDFQYVNRDYLYDFKIVENEYSKKAIQILDRQQINMNQIYDFNIMQNGLYYFVYDETLDHQIVIDLYSKAEFQIRTPEFNYYNDLSKYYKLDYHYFNNELVRTFYFMNIYNHQVIDISDTLLFFNRIAFDHKLFVIDEKVNDYYAKVHDHSTTYNIYTNPNNFFEIVENEYLLYSLIDNKYATIKKEHIDSLILDIIKVAYNHTIFTPSLIDYMEKVINEQNEIIKRIIERSDNDALNGLYLTGMDNKMFRVSTYQYEETITQDLTKYTRIFKYSPDLKFNDLPIYNQSFVYQNNDFKILDNYFWNIYGLTYFNEHSKLLFYLNGEQIDISRFDLKTIMWIFESYQNDMFDTKEQFDKFNSNTINETDVIYINDYNEIPSSKGFMKISKENSLYNFYFYSNYTNKYYYIKNKQLLDKLQDDVSTYKVTFEKTFDNFIVYFTNSNETVSWDLFTNKFVKEKHVYVTDEKLITSVIDNKITYNYLHFNLNINPDKITAITLNYNSRINYYFRYSNKLYSSTDLKNYTKTISDNESVNADKYVNNKNFVTSYYTKRLFERSKTYLSESISSSEINDYQHKILFDHHYSLSPVDALTGLGKLRVTKTYEDLTLLKISYFEDGVFYEDIDIDDQFPSDGDSDLIDLLKPVKDLINKIVTDFKSFIKDYKVIFYVIAGLFIIVIFSKSKKRK